MSIESENYLISLIVGCRAAASHVPLNSIDFTNETNQSIWLVAEQLETAGHMANILTITDSLNTKNIPCPSVDWNNYLNSLANDYKFMKNDKQSIQSAVSKVKQTSTNIKVSQIADDLRVNPDKAGEAIQMLLEATTNNTSRTSTTLQDGVKNALNHIDYMSKDSSPKGALTGLSELDETTGGMQPTDFIVVGARSAMGKTAFALTLIQNAVKDGRYAGIISVEMPDTQLGMRHIAGKSGVSIKKMRNGTVTPEEWPRITQVITNGSNEERKRILINDWTNDWDVIKTQIRTWASNHDMSGGVWIDYLQNLSVNRNGRSMEKIQEAMLISYECKALAKELNIPIIGLSQLQRGIDQQKDKRPSKSNLSWASQFENDADLIMLLYRHEVYFPDNNQAKGVAEIIIDKNRNGENTTHIVCFRGERMDFVDIEDGVKIQYIGSITSVDDKPKLKAVRDSI